MASALLMVWATIIRYAQGRRVEKTHISGPQVLVATSDPSSRQGVTECLATLGHRSSTVERGADALLAIADDHFGLAIIDLAIREPAGAKTVEIVRKLRPRLPVIVLSDDDSVETGRQVLRHGPFYYLLKPLNLDELGQIVQLALRRGRRSGNGER